MKFVIIMVLALAAQMAQASELTCYATPGAQKPTLKVFVDSKNFPTNVVFDKSECVVTQGSSTEGYVLLTARAEDCTGTSKEKLVDIQIFRPDAQGQLLSVQVRTWRRGCEVEGSENCDRSVPTNYYYYSCQQ